MQHSHPRAMASMLALSLAGALSWSGASMASGFALPEASAAGLGTANAMVANPDEVGAIPYNPAAMAFHDHSSIGLGSFLIGPNISVENAAGSTDSRGADWLATPLVQVAIKANDRLRVGATVTAPFGLETRWPVGTFPALSQTVTMGGQTIPTAPHPTNSKVEVVDFAPSLAYRVNDNLSLAAGLDVYWAKSAQLDSNLTRLRGDGYGLGFNLSALYKRDAFSAGLSFRSASTLSIDGMYTPRNQILVAAGRLAPAQTASVDFDLPWRLALGVRYEINDQLAVELDYNRTGWSNFESLEVDGDDTGPIFKDANDWEDSNAYRLGVTYQVRPETQLRFGYAYDETGQPDAHFSARVPDNDRQLFSIGLAQSLGNGYSIEGAYCYVVADDRDFRGDTPYTGGDVNGTSALDGKYSLDAHTLAIQLVKTF